MCPFGSLFMNETPKATSNVDLDGYDPNAPDSDDEAFSDVDIM